MIKTEGYGVTVGLAGTAVNPVDRWHSARPQDRFQPGVQFSLKFPTGTGLWQEAGGASLSSQYFLSWPNTPLQGSFP